MLVTRKRAEANGSQAVRCRSNRKQAAHYLAAALTISTAAPQARVKAPMRGTVTAKYILGDRSYIRRGVGQPFRP